MFKSSSKLYLLPITLLLVLTVSILTSSLPPASAEGNASSSSNDSISPIDDTITITVDSACTMGQTVLDSHTASLNPGETNSTIGSSRIAAYCNDSDGYAIYAIGYSNGKYGNTDLTNIDNTHTIPTGTSSTLGTNSYWNLKLTPASFGDYIPTIASPFTTNTSIPSDYTLVASYPSTTIPQSQDPTTSGSYFTTTYEAHISTTQPAGIYNGQVQYVMVHPSSAAAPEKPKTIDSIIFLQDFAAISDDDKMSVIASMNPGKNYTLKDRRDGQNYTVAKLPDGHVWMTTNLNLAGGSEVTSDFSDIPDGYTLPTSNGFQEGNRLPESATGYFNVDDKAFVYNSGVTGPNCSNPGCYSYYSWTAATAGSGLDISTDDTDAPYSICPKGWRLPTSGSYSNWKRGDFYALATSYGADLEYSYYSSSDDAFYSNAGPNTAVPKFLLTGFYSGDPSDINRRDRGFYWSSTSGNNNAYSRYLEFGPNFVNSAADSNRRYGLAVRCLVK